MAANPCELMSRGRSTSKLPTSTAITASAPSAAIEIGKLSMVPPSMQLRVPTYPGGKKPGRAHDAYTASTTGTSRSPGSPHTTRVPRSTSTVFTSTGVGKSSNVPAGETVAQRLLEVKRWAAHPLEQHAHVVDTEQVATPERHGARFHLAHAHAARVRGADERADARPGDDAGPDPALLERAHHPDVGESFQSAAA